MKSGYDEYDEVWFAKLDAIVMGRETPSQEDDDVLQVAAKLVDALSPLSNLDMPDVRDTHLESIHRQIRQRTSLPVRSRKHLSLHALLLIAALLFVFFGFFKVYPISIQISFITQKIGQQIWPATTSFDQIDTSSVALLAMKRAGVRPLLPGAMPTDTQFIKFGIVTDDTNTQTFTAFIAEYRVNGQDVSVYEQAANLLTASSAAQSVAIGIREGHFFQDQAGNSILQWYQDGMTCQIASTLPRNEVVVLARQFHPITRWELIQ